MEVSDDETGLEAVELVYLSATNSWPRGVNLFWRNLDRVRARIKREAEKDVR